MQVGQPTTLSARELLENATQLPWHKGFWGGQCFVKHRHGQGDCDYRPIAYDGDGLRSETPDRDILEHHYDSCSISDADTDLIVYAVNHLADYEAAVDALERTVALASRMYEDWPTIDIEIGGTIDEARAALTRLRGES